MLIPGFQFSGFARSGPSNGFARRYETALGIESSSPDRTSGHSHQRYVSMYCPCFASSALSEISMPVTTGSVFPALMALISVVRMDALYLASASMNSHKPTRAPIGTPTAIPAANTTAMRMTCRSVGLCHITFNHPQHCRISWRRSADWTNESVTCPKRGQDIRRKWGQNADSAREEM